MKKTLAKVLALALCAILLVTGTVFVTLAYLQANTKIVRNTFSSAGIRIKLDETKVNTEGKPVSEDGKTVLVDENGNPTRTFHRQQEGNTYELAPGSDYMKDPQITIEQGSAPCYVFIAVLDTMFESGKGDASLESKYLNDRSDAKYKYISEQLEDNGWVELEGKTIVNQQVKNTLGLNWYDQETQSVLCCTIYYYTESDNRNDGKIDQVVDAKNSDQVLPIMSGFSLKADLDSIDSTYENSEGDEVSKTIEFIAFAAQAQGMADAYAAWDATYGAVGKADGVGGA